MFGLLKKAQPCIGSVYFRGNLPPRAEEFVYLKGMGVELARRPDRADAHWELRLRHKKWGEAGVVCMRDLPPLPRHLIDWSASLSEEEKNLARAAGQAVSVRVESTRKDVLADRKRLLWFLGALMGDDGVVATDHGSELFWSRGMLDDELSHDADVDVEALYCLHAVYPGAEGETAPAPTRTEGEEEGDDEPWPVTWLHTHGLATIGAFDFDILNPTQDLTRLGADPIRALAFAVLEGQVKPSTANYDFAQPGGSVRFVPVGEFHRGAPAAVAALRDNDESHNRDRAVLCEPARGLFARWSCKVKPSRFLSRPIRDGTVFGFSSAATGLMAERARSTYGVFRSLHAEFEEFGLPFLVKLGYPVDGSADGSEREHLWFEVHAAGESTVEATLVNAPLAVAALREGDRGTHGAELLTDWTVITPAGPITPRSLRAARDLGENLEVLRQFAGVLREADGGDGGGRRRRMSSKCRSLRHLGEAGGRGSGRGWPPGSAQGGGRGVSC